MQMRRENYIVIYLAITSFFLGPSIYAETKTHALTLGERQLCDLEMLMNGGFHPLQGFLGEADYEAVVNNCRLSDGNVWPMPIVLDISEEDSRVFHLHDRINLYHTDGTLLAVLTISDLWRPDKEREARLVFRTTSQDHPGVDYLFNKVKEYYVGGKVEAVSFPPHYSFEDLRKTPNELKNYFSERRIEKIVAFQTRNPMHQAHVALTRVAAEKVGGHLLIQPVVGMTKPQDIESFVRVRCYRKILQHFPQDSTTLSVLPLAMRMAGPREALWHAIIRKNYGCTHFIVGRDHAGPGKDRFGNHFYEPYEAQELVSQYQEELGIIMIPFEEMVYVESTESYLPADEVQAGEKILTISGTELRRRLHEGLEIPFWFSYPEVIDELRKTYPLPSEQGITIFFTGLSGAGKSTVAAALNEKLQEKQSRSISLLDGDEIRKHLACELGFSKKDRALNIRRVGFVANEITKNRGIAICALIAPYEEDRRYNRDLINSSGNYVEIFLSTPLSICEKRDPKGLYAKVRKGMIKNFTGIDDPYEIPEAPDLSLDTSEITVKECVDRIIEHLEQKKLL